jgi:hypothetical protein
MKRSIRSTVFAVCALFALPVLAAAPRESAAEEAPMIHTGSGVRVKNIAFISVKVYSISHHMKCKVEKSRQAVIDANCDKRFALGMLRDVDKERIQGAFRDAFKLNGVSDQANIDKFVGAVSGDLKEKNGISISYNADKKATTIWAKGGGTVTIVGEGFMKAVWSIWFGKSEQPALGDALIANL